MNKKFLIPILLLLIIPLGFFIYSNYQTMLIKKEGTFINIGNESKVFIKECEIKEIKLGDFIWKNFFYFNSSKNLTLDSKLLNKISCSFGNNKLSISLGKDYFDISIDKKDEEEFKFGIRYEDIHAFFKFPVFNIVRPFYTRQEGENCGIVMNKPTKEIDLGKFKTKNFFIGIYFKLYGNTYQSYIEFLGKNPDKTCIKKTKNETYIIFKIKDKGSYKFRVWVFKS